MKTRILLANEADRQAGGDDYMPEHGEDEVSFSEDEDWEHFVSKNP